MDFFFPEMNPDLERLPPEKTRILSVDANLYPEGERVRVDLKVTPFLERPHIEVALLDADGSELSYTSLIEPMAWNLEFTMHLRDKTGPQPYRIMAHLFYPDGPDGNALENTVESNS